METQIILYAVPVFLTLILLELAWGYSKKKNNYRFNDAINRLSLGSLSQAVSVCTRFFQMGLYLLVYEQFALTQSDSFWNTWYGWTVAVILYDFFEYWAHRFSHQISFFWAAHAVHHQSQCFNLSTALRQESFYPITTSIFFMPLALLGISPSQYIVLQTFILVYQFWIHTEHIGRLGWFDRVFSSPSNHRVHHAINGPYLDKNFGAFLIVWDRLFGTFEEENETCIYGTTTPLNSWNPVWANWVVFNQLIGKSQKQLTWTDKAKVFLKSPDWPNTTPPKITHLPIYDPPVTHQKIIGASLIFIMSTGTLIFLLGNEANWNIELKIGFLFLIGLELLAIGWLLDAHKV